MLSYEEAKGILFRNCEEIDHKPPSSYKSKDKLRQLRETGLPFWNSGNKVYTEGFKTRARAYLLSYFEIQDQEPLPERGIECLGKQFIWLDKGIIKYALNHNQPLIVLRNGCFHLTDVGREFLYN